MIQNDGDRTMVTHYSGDIQQRQLNCGQRTKAIQNYGNRSVVVENYFDKELGQQK